MTCECHASSLASSANAALGSSRGAGAAASAGLALAGCAAGRVPATPTSGSESNRDEMEVSST